MSEFLISRPIFLLIGKDCLRLPMAVFILGFLAAHMMLLLYINTLILVYHESEYLFFAYSKSK
jgi:hypothetical protein